MQEALRVENVSKRSPLERYLPASFDTSKFRATWVDLSSASLKEPFFNQEISRLARDGGWTTGKSTSWAEVIRIADFFPPATPRSVIFHVSRCGSTLLTNIFREATNGIALSEAAPVDQLYRVLQMETTANGSSEKAELARQTLRALVTVYTRLYEQPLIIKTHTTSILDVQVLRSVWPETPFVMNVRDPLEVMVSNMEKLADWVKTLVRPSHVPSVFGLDTGAMRRMSTEEYCARGLGEFYCAALRSLDSHCRVIDYTDITASNIDAVLEALGAGNGICLHRTNIEKLFSVYSKDRTGKRDFSEDTLQKRTQASRTAHEFVEQWAYTPYRQLLSERPNSVART